MPMNPFKMDKKLLFSARRSLLAWGMGALALFVILQNAGLGNEFGFPIYSQVIAGAIEETHSPNSVTAIYLHYRYYDTLFEALMLLFSVIAVIYLSVHDMHIPYLKMPRVLISESILMKRTLALLYPFIFLAGAYITLNGHISPGGGFQGGAVLASIFIVKHLIEPFKDVQTHALQIAEKWLLLFILLIPITVFTMALHSLWPPLNDIYLVLMNTLISLKVASGLTVIFIRFVYFETL